VVEGGGVRRWRWGRGGGERRMGVVEEKGGYEGGGRKGGFRLGGGRGEKE